MDRKELRGSRLIKLAVEIAVAAMWASQGPCSGNLAPSIGGIASGNVVVEEAIVGPQEQRDIFATLVHGLQHRAEMATLVSGEATDDWLFSDQYIRPMLNGMPESGRPDVPSGKYDRGSFLVRFHLSERDWRYEVQTLIWSGGLVGWGFDADFKRDPLDAQPYYGRTIYHDGLIYVLIRGPNGAIVQVDPVEDRLPLLMRQPFGTWLGLALGPRSWADVVGGAECKLGTVRKCQYSGYECYEVNQGFETTRGIEERRLWIAPENDFAVVRMDALLILKDNPHRGYRDVHIWKGFVRNEGGPCFPTSYRHDHYEYGTKSDSPWVYSRRVALRGVRCREAAMTMHDELYPVGSIIYLKTRETTPEEQAALQQECFRPWVNAPQVFAHEPLPPQDPGFVADNHGELQPLDGTEIGALRARYRF